MYLEERLDIAVAHGDDEASPVRVHLGFEALRDLRGSRGDQDALEGPLLRPAEAPVSDSQPDVPAVQLSQDRLRPIREGREPFDAENLASDLGEDGRLISASGPHFQDSVGALQAQSLRHDGHHVGLRDGLALRQRDRLIEVGRGLHSTGEEPFSWDLRHGLQDLRALDSPCRSWRSTIRARFSAREPVEKSMVVCRP